MPIRVLVFEGSQQPQSGALHAAVADLDDPCFELTTVATKDAALAALAERDFDALLINLPGLNGDMNSRTVQQLHRAAPGASIVLAGAPDDDSFALEMVEYGVQQFIRSDKVDPDVIQRALRHAIARTVMIRRFADSLSDGERDREMDQYERLGTAGLSVSERMMGTGPLKQVAPDAFAHLVERYATLLDKAVEQQAYHITHDLSISIRELAVDLGRLRAGPRDVINIHSVALKERLKGQVPERGQVILEESRVLVIELMGDLVQYYRNLSLGIR